MQTHHTLDDGLRRVAEAAARVGVTVLAREAGLPLSTVRSFRDKGWSPKSITNCEKLIAAADRLAVIAAAPSPAGE